MTPLEQVYADTLECFWSAPQYLILSPDVDRLIYYSHLFPGIASLILAGILLSTRPKSISVIILAAISGLFFLYSIIDLLLWTLIDPSQIMFLWSLLIYVELLIYIGAVYLVITFVRKQDASLATKTVLALLFLPIIALGPTSLNLMGFDYSTCDRLAVEGPLAGAYTYALEVVLSLFIVGYLFFSRKTVTDPVMKKELSFLSIGILLFLLALSIGNIIGTLFQGTIGENSWIIAQYGLFGMPVFLGFIMYLIVKFKAFNTKIIGAQALVLSLWVLIGSMLFVAQTTTTRVIAGVTLFLVTIFGIILVRSVKKEVEQKEQIAKLADTLAQANERLKILDKMKSEFVSIASHQLRSPLTSIRGYASMLLEGSYGKLPDKAVEAATNIADSAKYMALSVEDYLNVSRIEAGNMKYEYSDFNLKDMAEKIVDEMRQVALKKGLVMMFRSDSTGSMYVHADIGKTRQIIMNLLDNSMKYTPKGTITVIAHDDVKKKKAYITIHDTGVGMSKETQEEVFDKFVRAKNANNVNTTGTGLGLYVAKKMITDMKGRVWAESEGEGKGSQFHIEFPMISGPKNL